MTFHLCSLGCFHNLEGLCNLFHSVLCPCNVPSGRKHLITCTILDSVPASVNFFTGLTATTYVVFIRPMQKYIYIFPMIQCVAQETCLQNHSLSCYTILAKIFPFPNVPLPALKQKSLAGYKFYLLQSIGREAFFECTYGHKQYFCFLLQLNLITENLDLTQESQTQMVLCTCMAYKTIPSNSDTTETLQFFNFKMFHVYVEDTNLKIKIVWQQET